MPNWIYCSSMVPLHMGVECGLLRASDMEHEFSNECRARSEGKPADLCVGIQEYSTIPIPELNERREGRHQRPARCKGMRSTPWQASPTRAAARRLGAEGLIIEQVAISGSSEHGYLVNGRPW